MIINLHSKFVLKTIDGTIIVKDFKFSVVFSLYRVFHVNLDVRIYKFIFNCVMHVIVIVVSLFFWFLKSTWIHYMNWIYFKFDL